MALPQHLTYGIGGTVYVEVDSLPHAATVTLIKSDGAAIQGHVSATISTINTTLSQNVSRRDLAINVASNTGFEAGKTFWLRDDPEELLMIASQIGGNTDTIAFICGASAGARFGLDAFPEPLLQGLEHHSQIETLAGRLYDRSARKH